MSQTTTGPDLPRTLQLALDIVLRRLPGGTRWVPWRWEAAGILPATGGTGLRKLRREGEAAEFLAGPVTLELHARETESYVANLETGAPKVFVVLEEPAGADAAPEPVLATVSTHEAGAYADAGERLVQPVAMPGELLRLLEAFVTRHHVELPFRKRRRDRLDVNRRQDGIGDPRVRQGRDVFRAPGGRRRT